MTHVTYVDVSPSTVNVNEEISVHITVQPDYLDLGPYDVVIYYSQSGAPGTWVSIRSLTGTINPLGGAQLLPVVKITLPSPGTYRIGAQDRGEPSQGNPAMYDFVNVTPVVSPGNGILSVETTPSGADVTVDGIYRGASPVMFEIAQGQHSVVLTKDGYQTVQRSVTVVSGQVATVRVTMSKTGDIMDTLVKYAPWIIVGSIALIGVAYLATRPRETRERIYYNAGRTARGAYEEARRAYSGVKSGISEE